MMALSLKKRGIRTGNKGEIGEEPPGCETQGLPAAQAVLKVGQAGDKAPQDGMPLCGGRKLLTASIFPKLSLLERGSKNPTLGQD